MVNQSLLKQDYQLHSSVNNFLCRSLKSVQERKSELDLKKMFYFKRYEHYIKQKCGYKPNIAVERGLESRILRSKYRGMLMPELRHDPKNFDVYLRKACLTLKNPTETSFNKSQLIKATVRLFRNLGPLKFFKPTSFKFASKLLNSSASAGFPFKGKKGANIKNILYMARSMRNVNLGGKFIYFPNLCSFRLQLRGNSPNVKIKTRIIYPYPGAITLIEQSFIFPIIKFFEKKKGHTFYTLGMNGQDMSTWLKKRKRRIKKFILSIDVSSWDQNMPNDVLICAFWVIKNMFILTPDQATLFYNQMLHSIVSYHCMVFKGKPHMFIKEHGIPSGSSWTNLIGTLCHAIIAEYFEPGILESERILLCSDDNMFETNCTLEQIKTKYLEFGLVIQIEKSDFFSSYRKVRFLGYNWNNCFRDIDISQSLNQMVFHSQFLVDLDPFEREIARSASILLTGLNGQKVFRELFPEIVDQINKGIDIKFHFLYGFGNPVTNPSVIGKTDVKKQSKVNVSLKEHLSYGHLIR